SDCQRCTASDMTFVKRHSIVEFAAENHLVTIYPSRYFAEAGGLISLGANYDDLSRRAASFVDKILKGTKPADLPVEQPTKFDLVINLRTAKLLGLTVPASVLVQATEVLE